jgi:hypothetical protein
MNIPLIKGRELDQIALKFGLKRKKLFWFIKESDKSLREKLLYRIENAKNINVSYMNVKFVGA